MRQEAVARKLACRRRRKRMRSRAPTAQHTSIDWPAQPNCGHGCMGAQRAAITDCYYSGGASSRYWCYARYYSSRCSPGAPPGSTTRSSPLPAGSSARRTNNCRSQCLPRCTREAAPTCYLVARHARQCALRVMACRNDGSSEATQKAITAQCHRCRASVPRVCLVLRVCSFAHAQLKRAGSGAVR